MGALDCPLKEKKMKFESQKIVPLLTSANIGASTDMDSINMANIHRATFLITCGACTGDVTFSMNSGATEGTKTNAVTFRYAMGGAAIGTAVAGSTASCDVLGATGETTAIAPTVALTCTTKMVVLEVEAANMTAGDKWLTVTAAATAGIVHCVAVLEPRYAGYRSATVLK
jgi:hypothetical protein